MEGKYLTKSQRDKLAVDTNKTHFHLGSTFNELEKKEEVRPVQPQSTKSLSAIMKASHFDLGSDKKTFNSETLSRFVPHQIPKGAYQVPEAVDIRKTHYFVGSYKETPKTPVPTSLPVKTATVMTPQLSSAHHFKLGTDILSPSSTSRHEYQAKQLPSSEKQQAEKLKQDLQKTSFGLGNDRPLYLSTKQEDFIKKPSVYEKKTGKLFESSVVLGSDQVKYEKNEVLVKDDHGLKTSNNEMLKDLRKSHFVFGNEKSEYKLSSWNMPGSPLLKQENFMEKVMKKTSLVLGKSSNPWKTSYEQAHSASPAPQPQTVRDRNSDKVTHFMLGSVSPMPFTSVHRNDFQQVSSPLMKTNEQADYIRRHHYELGTDKKTYKSQNNDYGKNTFSCSPGPKVDLKSSHFYLGSEKTATLTTNQESFKELKTNKPKIIKKHEKEIQSPQDNNAKNDWKTEQRARFAWIKPVADDFYQFSLE